MASCTTDSIELQNTVQLPPTNRVRCPKTIPPCSHIAKYVSERLASFSTLCNLGVIEMVSPIRLAGSGCIFDAEEEYIECTFCGKITKIDNITAMVTLYDLKHYHQFSCNAMESSMLKQERAIHQGIVNLDILKRMRHQRLFSNGVPNYGEVIREHGVTPRSYEFEVVDLWYDPYSLPCRGIRRMLFVHQK